MVIACPICRALGWRRALCATCAGEMHARLEPFARAGDGFDIYSLFTWERDRFPGLGAWLGALKGRARAEYWREPAVWALETFGARGLSTLVPVPSARARNHALAFARALAARTGWALADVLCLEPGAGPEQKRRTRAGRGRRSMELVGKLPTAPGPILLVDDIVTTGATLKAAYRALGRPPGARAWCLADRRPCGDRGRLL